MKHADSINKIESSKFHPNRPSATKEQVTFRGHVALCRHEWAFLFPDKKIISSLSPHFSSPELESIFG